MSIVHAQVDFGGNNVQSQPVGVRTTSQEQFIANATAGASTLTTAMVFAGIIDRTGPTANYSDTFPSADQVLLAQPELSAGDSFKLVFRNTVAFAMTPVAGEGCVLGANVDAAASSVREYLITVLSNAPRQVVAGNTTNGSPTITGIPLFETGRMAPGQGITGTGIPANAFILSVNQAVGTIVISANATATALTALTVFSRYNVRGVRSSSL